MESDKVNSAVDSIIESNALNPYEDEINYNGVYHNVKMILLAPLSLLRIFWILVVVLFAYIFSMLASEKRIIKYFPIFPRLILFGFGFYHIPVANRQHLADALRDRGIAVYNHISFLDGFIVTACVHPFAFVINSNQGSVCVMTHIVRKLHYLLVDYDRGGGQTAKITEHAERPGSNMLAIAPEGTTTNGVALLRFRTGAFVPLRPVLPIIIRRNLLPRTSTPAASAPAPAPPRHSRPHARLPPLRATPFPRTTPHH